MYKINPVREFHFFAPLESSFLIERAVCTEDGFNPLSALCGNARRLKPAAFSNGVKGQALISVILLLTLVTVLIAGLTSAWRTETKIHLDTRDAIKSFYLAQAGLELAKIELVNDWNWGGTIQPVLLGDGVYSVNVNIVGPTVRNIVALGRVRDCEKSISANIIQTGAPPAVVYNQGPLSWREL